MTLQKYSETAVMTKIWRIGCVSYLNAKPLIEGLDSPSDLRVRFDVPSRLLGALESGDCDIALCPVIDYCRAVTPLVLVPSGGIGCLGSTLTVRIFSRVPIEDIQTVHADTDSHTSVALLQILMRQIYDRDPYIINFDPRTFASHEPTIESPEAILLIGDKVVTDAPGLDQYPHQLDLGQAWHKQMGLPFVFAIWMSRRGVDLGTLPARLDAQRCRNMNRIAQIADRYAGEHGWSVTLARRYMGQILRFDTDEPALAAISRFFSLAAQMGIISDSRPIVCYESAL